MSNKPARYDGLRPWGLRKELLSARDERREGRTRSTDPNQFDRWPWHSVWFEKSVIVDGDGNEIPIPDTIIYSDEPIQGGDLMEFLGGEV